MKNVYGLSRSRDPQGNVIKRSLNPYVNCLHTRVGSARDNMEVYVIEIMENPKIISMPHGYNTGGLKDIAPTCTANAYEYNNFVLEPKIVAMRGRNPDNPSERGRSNGNYKQRLEVNENGTSNTLTSVQKDNLVIEPTIIDDTFPGRDKREYNNYSPALRVGGGGFKVAEATKTMFSIEQVRDHQVTNYRIRKLTPRECFRLMGVAEADIPSDKLAELLKGEDKLIVPKFKMGDKIEKLGYRFTIIQVKDNNYLTKCGNKIPIDNQDDFALVPYKFDITTLSPFDKVLVRDSYRDQWRATLFSHIGTHEEYPYETVCGRSAHCIPYKGNEYLLGTSKDCDDYYKIWKL